MPPALLDVGLPPGAAGLGVYEYLRSDSTLLAQQTVSKLEALELRRHAALAAWTGGLLVRAIGLFVILVAVAIFQLSTNVDINQDVLWVVAGLLLAVYLLRAATTVYEISGGRLTVERGILWRRIRQVELWRIQGIERRQGLIDRITGHGELRFTTVSAPGGVIKVRGLARGRRLKDIHAQLVDLVFLLRSNPVVKGIIS